MKISELDETRVSSARARRFFNMLSERKRKMKREQEELRKRQEVLWEAEKNRYQAIKASPRDLKKPSVVPQPPLSEQPPEQQEPVKAVSIDQASLDFWKWCVGKEEKEEEPPPWKVRNTRLYRGAKW